MSEYRLTIEAEHDLIEIARYTADAWGFPQAERYLRGLEMIGRGETADRAAFDSRTDFRLTRCQRHVVFFVRPPGAPALILAVLHERMDLVGRLRERLSLEDSDER